MGQELRQKQDNGATAVLGHSGEGVATSDGSDDYGEEDLDVLSGDEGYVHGLSPQLRSVKKVPLPKAGVLSMGFMEKASGRTSGISEPPSHPAPNRPVVVVGDRPAAA